VRPTENSHFVEQDLLHPQIPVVDRIRRCSFSLFPLGRNIYSSLLRTEHQVKEVRFALPPGDNPIAVNKCIIYQNRPRRPRGVEEVQLYSFFNLSARWSGRSTPRLGRFTPGKDPVPIVEEAGWAPGQVWTGAENLAPHRDSNTGPSIL
jgi:hypothetical protein